MIGANGWSSIAELKSFVAKLPGTRLQNSDNGLVITTSDFAKTSRLLNLKKRFNLFKKNEYIAVIGGQSRNILIKGGLIAVVIFVIIIAVKENMKQRLAIHPQVYHTENDGQRTEQIKQIIPVQLIGIHHYVLIVNPQKGNGNGGYNKRHNKRRGPNFMHHVFADKERHQHI